MIDWKDALLSEDGTIADAVRILEAIPAHICLVVNRNGKLLGTITDGDVRRGLLRSLPLSAPAREVMKATPTVGRMQDDGRTHLEAMQKVDILQLPLVDSEFRVTGLVTARELTEAKPCENWVVLMAGGMGLRLRPFTDETPKPMLTVGTKPLLETTLENFIQQNFRRFFISVNYLSEKVKDYLGDGSRWGCEIQYLEEKNKLGTAGALGLLPEKPMVPLIVMNGDVLTKVNFRHLLEFHREHKAAATMCVREYDFQVPYGVVNLNGTRINSLVEKPAYSFFVNAGIYVIEPDLVASIPQPAQRYDMTDLFEAAIKQGQETAAFPIREYWIDIGHLDDFDRAKSEYHKVFD